MNWNLPLEPYHTIAVLIATVVVFSALLLAGAIFPNESDDS